MPTLSITYDAVQANRIIAMWESKFGYTPTNTDVKQWLVGRLRDEVLAHEKHQAIVALADAPFDPT